MDSKTLAIARRNYLKLLNEKHTEQEIDQFFINEGFDPALIKGHSDKPPNPNMLERMASESEYPRLTKMGVGYGKSLYDKYEGLKQRGAEGLNLIGQLSDAELSNINQGVADRRQMDKPLEDDPWAKGGQIASDVVTGAATSMLPFANTLTGATALGGGYGLAMPTVEGESVAQNVGLGAASGLGSQYVMNKAGNWLNNQIGKRVAKKANEKLANSYRDEVWEEARDAGFKVSPEEIEPSMVRRGIAKMSGKKEMSDYLSRKNQENFNKIAAKSIGLDESTPLTQASIEKAKAPAIKAYEKVQQKIKILDTSINDGAYHKALTSNTQQLVRMSEQFSSFMDEKLMAQISALNFKKIHTEDAVLLMRTLRNLAAKAYRDGDDIAKTAADAFIKTSDSIEDLLDANANKLGIKGLSQQLRDARKLFAKVFSVEAVTDTKTGTVNPSKLSGLYDRKVPLDGDMLKAAKFAGYFTSDSKMMTPDLLSQANFSAKDLYSAAAPLAATPLVDLGATGTVAAGIAAGRPASRAFGASNFMQNRLNPNYGIGLVPQAMQSIANNPVAQRGAASVPGIAAQYGPEYIPGITEQIANSLTPYGGY